MSQCLQRLRLNRSLFPQGKLDRLRQKFACVVFPDELDAAAWGYGCPLAHVQRLVHHQHTMSDCRKAEAELIRMPQFTTDIAPERFETLKIHSVHKCCESRARFHYYLHMAGPGHLTRSERYYQS